MKPVSFRIEQTDGKRGIITQSELENVFNIKLSRAKVGSRRLLEVSGKRKSSVLVGVEKTSAGNWKTILPWDSRLPKLKLSPGTTVFVSAVPM